MRAWRIAFRASIVVLFVIAALCMRSHQAVAGALFALGTAMLALTFAVARRVDEINAAVAARDVEALERIAEHSIAYRYQAVLLVGVLGSAARARALGRATPCVCGECEEEEIDRDLSRALDACELLEKDRPREALRLMKIVPRPRIARAMHGPFVLYVALHAKKLPPHVLDKVVALAPKAGFMRWPLESLITARLNQSVRQTIQRTNAQKRSMRKKNVPRFETRM
ncbi:MAG TPA: hypothetical protein VGH87_04955 [Polyangiaceae bacterium]|jgi:hypothetical protein